MCLYIFFKLIVIPKCLVYFALDIISLMHAYRMVIFVPPLLFLIIVYQLKQVTDYFVVTKEN